MRIVILIVFAFIGSIGQAEDGLNIQVTIAEQANGSNRLQTYTNAFLMRLNEEVSIDFSDKYVLKVSSRQIHDANLSLVVTLKDMIDGKPYYVGARPVEIKIGDIVEIELENYDTTYTLNLDTSYGKIPD